MEAEDCDDWKSNTFEGKTTQLACCGKSGVVRAILNKVQQENGLSYTQRNSTTS
ncbi:hypothetical protein H6G64_32275 [Calothrix sp. FACHB-156]|nr:hypothetical protein [Calothrix sp. FACHB-156]